MSTETRVGSELAGYRLETLVGRGGMGVVYRAYDLALERPVALKILAPELAEDERFRERFLRESRLAASIDHPNIVPVYDAGEVAGELYIAMRYVDGAELKQLLADGPLPEGAGVAIAAQIAAALDAAHARGLVHRDVKPSNVLVTADGHVYLADFGLTRRLSDQAAGFEAGLSLGTPAYVAPEQIEGKEVDGRADQYSLACLLHECLTGVTPFARSTEAAVLFAHLEEVPPAPPGLEQVLPRALDKDPARRYATCAELIDAARRALGIASPARSRWPLAVAGLGLAVIAAALLAFFLTRGGGGPATTGTAVRLDAATGKVTARVAVGNDPEAIAAGPDGVWVANSADGTVSKIDPGGSQVTTIRVSGLPVSLAVGGGVVLVATAPAGEHVDPDQSPGRQRLRPDPPALRRQPPRRASSRRDRRGSGWRTRSSGPFGASIPPAVPTSASSRRGDCRSTTAWARSTTSPWAGTRSGSPATTKMRRLWRVDPRTARVVATIVLPIAPHRVAVGEGRRLGDGPDRERRPPDRSATGSRRGADPGRPGRQRHRRRRRLGVGRERVRRDGLAHRSPDEPRRGDDPGRRQPARPCRLRRRGLAGGEPRVRRAAAAVLVAGILGLAGCGGGGKSTIRIGVLGVCQGAFAPFYQEVVAGAELPLLARGAKLRGPKPTDGVRGAKVAGHPVDLVFGCSDETGERALAEVRRLVEKEHVQILVGAETTAAGIAIRDYAKTQPDTTFLIALAPTAEATLSRPAPNVFRFTPHALQWTAGLGTYAYRTLGWRTAVVVGNDFSSPYDEAAGFIAEFCSLGGKVVGRVWAEATPPAVRTRADGYFVTVFLSQLLAGAVRALPVKGDLAHRLLLGAATIGDAGTRAREAGGRARRAVGQPDRHVRAGLDALLADYAKAFPKLPFLGFAPFYYDTMEPALRGLEAVDGDLSDGGRQYRAALARLELDLPTGHVRLDAHRQAIAPNYLVRVGRRAPLRTIRTVGPVDDSYGGRFGPGKPLPSRTSPACVQAATRRPGPADQPLSDQVKRVRFSAGARPPGRRPLRTSSVGWPLPASAPRVGPRPSLRQRSDRPTTVTPSLRGRGDERVRARLDEERLGGTPSAR